MGDFTDKRIKENACDEKKVNGKGEPELDRDRLLIGRDTHTHKKKRAIGWARC